MFCLTRQEKQVMLFLLAIVLAGLAIDFAVKINSRVEKLVKLDEQIAKMDINKVSLNDLLHSKCVSHNLAEKIIEYRSSRGRFSDLEELKEVKGIGEYRFGKLREVLFVE